jgi:hypothetical protein
VAPEDTANHEEDVGGLLRCVGSPIPQNATELMTDDQWISAMQKYDGSTDRFKGGPHELSQSLAEFARKDCLRFASLVAKMPDDLKPIMPATQADIPKILLWDWVWINEQRPKLVDRWNKEMSG